VVDHAYLIGQTAPEIAAAMQEKRIPTSTFADLSAAVTAASGDASAGDVVLLAPACASFDQFTGYAHRGDTFRDAARRAGAR
jgi:UDP-N-acetylmuramoylalanine--D-glutamate ligase